ncbi:MFS transporter [Pseudonocardia endophytica]|uniref:MFS transporter n=1 Tax=Pseudonocardia endophytica TaxID=401976 RepID=A0A4R1HYD0_PSEEN|nr:MFS transporter [Pseudonocardia endophytica]TCK27824.1 MFS transporter [Pseudonocardia endophytica]
MAPVLASALGRLPIAMLSLAVLLYVHAVQGSFAVGGAVSAGVLAGTAVGMVVQGRVVDRLGPTRPLLVVAALFAVAGGFLVVVVDRGHGLATLFPLAVTTGLFSPSIEGASRALWTDLTPSGPVREAAFNYEAISLEVFFILGPGLAALLVATTPWPGTALVAAVAAMATGTVLFALSPRVRARSASARSAVVERAGMLGVIRRPGLRTVALASLGFGLVIGSVEVGVPAAATAAGSPAAGGLLLSAWSVISVAAGVLYGLRPWPRSMGRRLPVLLGTFAVLVGLTALVAPLRSLPLLAVTLLLAGATITPQVTAHSHGVDLTAPDSSAAEAFSWVVTSAVIGVSAGQSLAGLAVDTVGPAGFAVGPVLGLVVACVLWLRRRTVVPAAEREVSPV